MRKYVGSLLFLGLLVTSVVPSARANTINDIKSAISDRATKIIELERDINRYQGELLKVGKEKQTLESAVRALQLSDKKLTKDLQLTSTKINTAELTIEELEFEINRHENHIRNNSAAVSEAIRNINAHDGTSLIELVLAYENLSDAWEGIDSLASFQDTLFENTRELQALRLRLAEKKLREEQTKNELASLKSSIADKKKVLSYTREEKNKLLQVTKSQESNYKSLLDEKLALKAQFQRELQTYEAQLKIAIDPSSIPSTQSSQMIWPIDKVIITQRFGNTAFALAGAYNGKGHNGVDFGTPIGTPVKSVLPGTVLGAGDTDLTCPNASYGKWIVVRHGNGLSTLYAHLSVIKVSEGQSVGGGDIIGFSGNTGYSTGPHLHFTVYASQGMRIDSLPSAACGGRTYRLPVADLKAYLDPLSYLK